MKINTANFELKSNALQRNPHYAIAISFDDANTDILWLTSHSTTALPLGTLSENVVASSISARGISGKTQSIKPDTAESSIGSVTIKAQDINRQITNRINDRLGSAKSLRKKQIKIYIGFENLVWDDYTLALTFIIHKPSYKDGNYRFVCNDIQREEKREIFVNHSSNLAATISATDTTIPLTSLDNTLFPTLQHDEKYPAAYHPSEAVGYGKIENEIFKHNGIHADGDRFENVERGVLDTVAVAHEVTAGDDDKKIGVDEYIWFEGIAVDIIYKILTGTNWPEHWSLGIDPNYIDLASLQNIGTDLWNLTDNTGKRVRFWNLDNSEGKRFLSKEFLIWLGCFIQVNGDGQIGLKRLGSVLPFSGYDMHITDSDIISYGDLVHNYDQVINDIVVNWNWIRSQNRFSKKTQIIDADSIAKYGRSEQKQIDLRGVVTGSHTTEDLLQYFDSIRDRHIAPPITIEIVVPARFAKLDVGDRVRLSSSHIIDYNDPNQAVDRTFEVQFSKINWIAGNVSLKLFGGVEQSTLVRLISNVNLLNSALTPAGGTDISTLPGVVISAGVMTSPPTNPLAGDPNDAGAAIYYYDGDLELASDFEITDNVTLMCTGDLFQTCKINGKGKGCTGGLGKATYDTTINSGELGLGRPQSGAGVKLSVSGALHQQSYHGMYQIENLGVDYDGVPFELTRPIIGNIDGSEIENLFPINLRGTGGCGGQISFATADGLNDSSAYGGNGGNGGAGLVIIARGHSFGAGGETDLSGDDGTLGEVVNTPWSPSAQDYIGGAGAGGSAGGCLIILDGSSFSPDRQFIIQNNGAAVVNPAAATLLDVPYASFPLPVELWPFLNAKTGTPAAAHPDLLHILSVPDSADNDAFSEALLEQQAASTSTQNATTLYGGEILNVEQEWEDVLDGSLTRPEDNANYITVTSELTDDAGLGDTAVWDGISDAPELNEIYNVQSWANGFEITETVWNISAGHSVEYVPESYSGVRAAKVTTTTVDTNASGTIGGLYIEIPEQVALEFGGKRVKVACYAKADDVSPASKFSMAYSTKDNGNSAWREFTLDGTWTQYIFEYDVPAPISGGSDYIGLQGFTDGDVLFDRVFITTDQTDYGTISAEIDLAQSDAETAAAIYAEAQDALEAIRADAYTDGEVDIEEARAILDATTKANAAEADAIAAAELYTELWAEENATVGADWITNLDSVPYDIVTNNDDATVLGFNPAFALWSVGDNYPTGWAVWTGVPLRETSIVRVGDFAVRWVCTVNQGMTRNVSLAAAPLPAGTFLAGSVDVYIHSFSSGGSPGYLIDVYNSTGVNNRTTINADTSKVGVWQRIPFIARTNDGSAVTRIQIYQMGSYSGMSGGNFIGTVIFDNLQFALFNSAIDNTSITLNSDGSIDGAGGGLVTITGLGFVGDLAATENIGDLADLDQVGDAEIVDGTQITDAGISTSVMGQRIVVNVSGDELEFYDLNSDQVATIGINSGDVTGDNTILKLGATTDAAGGIYRCIEATSFSSSWLATFRNYGTGNGLWVEVADGTAIFGIAGGVHAGDTGIYARSVGSAGVPFVIAAGSSLTPPVSADNGSMWTKNLGKEMYVRLDGVWSRIATYDDFPAFPTFPTLAEQGAYHGRVSLAGTTISGPSGFTGSQSSSVYTLNHNLGTTNFTFDGTAKETSESTQTASVKEISRTTTYVRFVIYDHNGTALLRESNFILIKD